MLDNTASMRISMLVKMSSLSYDMIVDKADQAFAYSDIPQE